MGFQPRKMQRMSLDLGFDPRYRLKLFEFSFLSELDCLQPTSTEQPSMTVSHYGRSTVRVVRST